MVLSLKNLAVIIEKSEPRLEAAERCNAKGGCLHVVYCIAMIWNGHNGNSGSQR